MSANLDLVRSIYADWERGDFSRADWADPEIEFAIVGGPQPGRWKGLAGLAEGTGDLLDAWEGFRADAEEYRELDDDGVLVLVRMSGRGRHSDLELEQMYAEHVALFQVRDDKVTKHAVYVDRDRALADLGLEG
jgi:ketosteroid isomerase-like protein